MDGGRRDRSTEWLVEDVSGKPIRMPHQIFSYAADYHDQFTYNCDKVRIDQ